MKFLTRILPFALFSFLLLSNYEVYSAEKDVSQTIAKLKSFEIRFSEIEKSQTTILKEQDEIVEEIKGLKIWVNKHRGGKN